jgi:hypothetical protein
MAYTVTIRHSHVDLLHHFDGGSVGRARGAQTPQCCRRR